MDAMQLSLSVRVAETPMRKDRAAMAFEPLMQLAAALGYKGISMRASQANIDTPAARVAEMKQLMDDLGLVVSMCTGTVGLAANDDQATAPLRDIGPHLDLAERFGCDLVRVMIKEADDIPWTRRAADIARERGMRLVHQTHIRTMCETVAETLDVVQQVGRPNFGVTYEPSNLAICGDDYGPEALRQLAPHLFNVYLQNWHIHPEGKMTIGTNRGDVRADQPPLSDERGLDLDRVFAGLREVGYAGWVTVHQAMGPGETVEQAARASYDTLRPYVE